MAKNKKKSDVPFKLFAIGGFAFLLGVLIHPLIAGIGVLSGMYIMKKYPKKRIHWIIPIVFNGILFMFGVMIIILEIVFPVILGIEDPKIGSDTIYAKATWLPGDCYEKDSFITEDGTTIVKYKIERQGLGNTFNIECGNECTSHKNFEINNISIGGMDSERILDKWEGETIQWTQDGKCIEFESPPLLSEQETIKIIKSVKVQNWGKPL